MVWVQKYYIIHNVNTLLDQLAYVIVLSYCRILCYCFRNSCFLCTALQHNGDFWYIVVRLNAACCYAISRFLRHFRCCMTRQIHHSESIFKITNKTKQHKINGITIVEMRWDVLEGCAYCMKHYSIRSKGNMVEKFMGLTINDISAFTRVHPGILFWKNNKLIWLSTDSFITTRNICACSTLTWKTCCSEPLYMFLIWVRT